MVKALERTVIIIDRRKKETIRKGVKNIKKSKLFLYGNLGSINRARGYCRLHKCYLTYSNILEKNCNRKNCMHLKKIK